MLVERTVVDERILYRQLQILREQVVGTHFIECFCRVPFPIAPIQIIPCLYVNLVCNDRCYAQCIESVSLIAVFRQIAVCSTCFIGVC